MTKNKTRILEVKCCYLCPCVERIKYVDKEDWWYCHKVCDEIPSSVVYYKEIWSKCPLKYANEL